ncbi:MAG: hypothetical protein KC503_42035 [Myxococcales bacterium]|nr:hypothetical protein [Myxococcales bacterium]
MQQRTRWTAAIAFAALASVAVALPACDGGSVTGGSCTTTADCPAGQDCINNRCTARGGDGGTDGITEAGGCPAQRQCGALRQGGHSMLFNLLILRLF